MRLRLVGENPQFKTNNEPKHDLQNEVAQYCELSGHLNSFRCLIHDHFKFEIRLLIDFKNLARYHSNERLHELEKKII
jgi:hypothetical protein